MAPRRKALPMPDPEAQGQTPGWGPELRRRLESLLARPFRSLPSRIVTSVFSAALVTSLVVSFISTRSIESFLREKIDEKFPALLHGTLQRLDLYYAQRQLDVETFARSAVVTASSIGLSGPRAAASRAELRTYLAYVLERFPQYQAFFVLDPEGRTLLWIGVEPELPAALRARAARVTAPTVGGLEVVGERRVQLASAPVSNAREERIASLHALLEIGAVEQLLRAEGAGQNLDLFVVGSDGCDPAHRAERLPAASLCSSAPRRLRGVRSPGLFRPRWRAPGRKRAALRPLRLDDRGRTGLRRCLRAGGVDGSRADAAQPRHRARLQPGRVPAGSLDRAAHPRPLGRRAVASPPGRPTCWSTEAPGRTKSAC